MAKLKVSPLRVGALLIDENGRKWRVNKEIAFEGTSRATDGYRLELEPDHTNCLSSQPCKHYGETYL